MNAVPRDGRHARALATTYVAAALVSLAMASPCLGARPLATDDAGVLDPVACEWESFVAALRTAGPGQGSAWQTQLGCGVGAGAQLTIASGHARSVADKTDVVGFAGKLHLFGDEASGPVVAATAGVNMLHVDRVGYELQDHTINFVVSDRLSPDWTAHANLGWTRNRMAKVSSLLWNAAVERALGHEIDIGLEVYGDDRRDIWAGTGARWAITASSSINAAFGVQAGRQAARFASAGYKFSF